MQTKNPRCLWLIWYLLCSLQRRGGLPVWWVPFESHLKNSLVNEFGCIIPGLLAEDSNSHRLLGSCPAPLTLSQPSPRVSSDPGCGGRGLPYWEARSQGRVRGLCSPTLLFKKEKAALIPASRAMPTNLMTMALLAFKNPFIISFSFLSLTTLLLQIRASWPKNAESIWSSLSDGWLALCEDQRSAWMTAFLMNWPTIWHPMNRI